MNTVVKFVKSFSKGQITIPKDFRAMLGMKDDFWLRMKIVDRKIVAEPVEQQDEKQLSREEYIQKLLTLKGDWLDVQEMGRNRKRTEKKLRRVHTQLNDIFKRRKVSQ